jgi:ketosteroid isomerase-like protein
MSEGEQLMRTMYAAWNEGGVTAAARFWAEDVVIHDFPELPDAVVMHGRAEATQIWEERVKTFEIALEVTSVEEVGPDRIFAVLEVHAKGSATGISVNDTHLHVVTLRGGEVAEAMFFRDRAQAREAAGLPPE